MVKLSGSEGGGSAAGRDYPSARNLILWRYCIFWYIICICMYYIIKVGTVVVRNDPELALDSYMNSTAKKVRRLSPLHSGQITSEARNKVIIIIALPCAQSSGWTRFA